MRGRHRSDRADGPGVGDPGGLHPLSMQDTDTEVSCQIVNNIYQLLALVVVAGLQAATAWGVKKLTTGQSQLKGEIEASRVEMFRLANLTDTHVIRSEGHVAGVAATLEAALKVAYLQGKVDAKGGTCRFRRSGSPTPPRSWRSTPSREGRSSPKLQQPRAPRGGGGSDNQPTRACRPPAPTRPRSDMEVTMSLMLDPAIWPGAAGRRGCRLLPGRARRTAC